MDDVIFLPIEQADHIPSEGFTLAAPGIYNALPADLYMATFSFSGEASVTTWTQDASQAVFHMTPFAFFIVYYLLICIICNPLVHTLFTYCFLSIPT